MSLLVTGSIGLDTVETPAGKREDIIGGSAIYFATPPASSRRSGLWAWWGKIAPNVFSPSLKAATSIPAAWKSAKGARPSAGTAHM